MSGFFKGLCIFYTCTKKEDANRVRYGFPGSPEVFRGKASLLDVNNSV